VAGWRVKNPGYPKRGGALAETRAAGTTAPAAGGEPRGTATARRNGRKGASGASGAAAAALTLGALGIVFGDIGTSPLYAMSSIFAVHGVRPDVAGVDGMISLVVWTIVLVVSVKYVTFVMRADNRGEGGIMALVALVLGLRVKGRAGKAALVLLGIFGVALFFGDGTITPAISVISSVEGLGSAQPGLKSFVLPVTLTLLTVLFAGQRFGTRALGRLFGPAMALWFTILAASGLAKVIGNPVILKALSPSYGLAFFLDHPLTGFLALGAIVLVVTGAEALYADLGQFDRPSITRAWIFVVFPALIINYLGQGAMILRSPKVSTNLFFEMFPRWAQLPMVVVAVAAAMIASQAVITGAFSVTRQAVQLGFLPRLRIQHKSGAEGQIYVPAVNRLLYIAVIGLVIGFGSAAALASAYGIAVTGTFATTTILFFVVVRVLWKKPLWIVLPGAAAFLVMDLAFFTSNLTKVVTGGWFPLAVALIIFTLLSTWQRGRELVTAKRSEAEGLLLDFVEEIRNSDPPLHRVPGTAVFPTAGKKTTPLALRDNVNYNHVLHDSVVIVSVETATIPHVGRSEQIAVDDLGYEDDGIVHLTVRYGFQDDQNVPAALRQAAAEGLPAEIDVETATYFVSEITIVLGDDPGMRTWRKRLFLLLSRTSKSPVDFFGLPQRRIVTMGSYIEL
jgi:KUP system potassium uptake protein